MSIRITTGSLKGRNIDFKYKNRPRPTQSRVRDALFNIMVKSIAGSSFLDLFAGSGAVGITAYSNGATEIAFAEIDPQLNISLNANLLKYSVPGLLYKCDYQKAIAKMAQTGKKFDFIFIDPPYYKDLAVNAAKLCFESNLLNENGYIIIEKHEDDPSAVSLLNQLGNVERSDLRKYGSVELEFYSYKTIVSDSN